MFLVEEDNISNTLLQIAGYELEEMLIAKEVFDFLRLDSSGIARMIKYRKQLNTKLERIISERNEEMKIEWKNKTWKTPKTKRHAFACANGGKEEFALCDQVVGPYYTMKTSISHFLHGEKCKKCSVALKVVESKFNGKLSFVDYSQHPDFVKEEKKQKTK
jgi:hypothetical protein